MTDMDDEAMKAMAARIANGFAPYDDTATGCAIATVVRKAVIAAIIETRDRDAALADEHVLTRPDDDHQLGQTEAAQNIAAAIRSGQQFRKDV